MLDNFWLSAREVPIKYNLCKLDLMKIVCLKTLNSIYIIFAETLLKEKFHLRTQHSVLLGYWTTELGGLNQVVHLWQYGQYHTILRDAAKGIWGNIFSCIYQLEKSPPLDTC